MEYTKTYLKPWVLHFKEALLGEDPTDVERVMMKIRQRGSFKPWGSAVAFVQSTWTLAAPSSRPQDLPPRPERTAAAGCRNAQGAGAAEGVALPKLLRTTYAMLAPARIKKISEPAPIIHHIDIPRRAAGCGGW